MPTQRRSKRTHKKNPDDSSHSEHDNSTVEDDSEQDLPSDGDNEPDEALSSEDEQEDEVDTVLERIKALTEKKMWKSNPIKELKPIAEAMKKIRNTSAVRNDCVTVANEILEWSNQPSVTTEYKKFRLVYEFVFHIHKIYGVQLNAQAKAEDDSKLLCTMEKAIRKFLDHRAMQTFVFQYLTLSI
jgi:hypothetical protein